MSPVMNRLDNEENIKLKIHRRIITVEIIGKTILTVSSLIVLFRLTTCGFLIKPKRAPMCMETVSNPFQTSF